MHVTIVGAGQAGGTVARTLRAEGFEGRITVIGREPCLPYERPPLSKGFLTDPELPRLPLLLSAEAWRDLDVDFRLDAKAERIDRPGRRVLISHGEPVPYDALVLATGGEARRPPLPGLGEVPAFTLRSLADALALRSALRESRSLAIIGGGWIGLEVAASARTLGLDVTVIEAAPRLAMRSAPPVLSDWLLALHRNHGVTVRTGAPATRLAPAGKTIAIHLDAGAPILADLLVVGAGLSPAADLAREAGLPADNGVPTDWCGRTEDPHIYAVGDVATVSPGARRLESWDHAISQSVACARAILGKDPGLRPVPWFWSDQFEHTVQLAGELSETAGMLERRAPDARGRSWFFMAGDRLSGVIAIDDPKTMPVARRLIAAGRPLDPEKLADPAIPLRDLLVRA